MKTEEFMRWATGVTAALLLGLTIWVIASNAQAQPLVFSYQPRDVTPIKGASIAGKPVQIDEGANWQWKMDAGRFFTHTESDVIYFDKASKDLRNLTNCTNTPEICAGQSATVSHDAKWIVYQKSIGRQLRDISAFYTNAHIQDKQFHALSNELWAYNIESKKATRLTSGAQDITPTFCGDRIVWASDRFAHFPPYQTAHVYPHKGTTIVSAPWKDGSIGEIKNLTPHEMLVMSPECLSNGSILYSSWQGYSRRGRYDLTTTPQNIWWINVIDGNGANALTIASLGAHGSPYIPTAELIADELSDWGHQKVSTLSLILRPARQIAITAEGKPYVGVGLYYRTNHTGGGGEILGYTVQEYEGVSILNNWLYKRAVDRSNADGSGAFVPPDLRSLTPWGHGFDAQLRFDKSTPPKIMGKANYAAAYPGDKYLMTWFRGACYEGVLGWEDHDFATRKRLGGEPTCQPVICLADVGQMANPHKECNVLVGGESGNYWDARAVATYKELFGLEKPAETEPLPFFGKTELRVVDFNSMELTGRPSGDPIQAYKNRLKDQGHATPDVEERMDQFCVDIVEPWEKLPGRPGYKSRTLYKCQSPQPNGSLTMEVPPDTLIVMYGIDSTFQFPEGREPTWKECINVEHGMCIVAEDQMLHSLRDGEKRTCHGCHDAHSKERQDELGNKSAEERFRVVTPPGCGGVSDA